MKKMIFTVAAMLLSSTSAQAGNIGVYTNGGVFGAASSQLTAQGHTAVSIADLSAASLAGLTGVWILNGDNGAQITGLGGNTDFATSVPGVVQFLYHDRNVTAAATALGLVGRAAIAFTRDLSSNIDVENAINPMITGPGGTIDNNNLDGGNFSNHGWAAVGSLPAGSLAFLNNGTAGQVTDFQYAFGNGSLMYSTVPADFYLSGGGSNGANFRGLYMPNAIAQAFGLNRAVPEPATWMMLILGMGIVGAAMRRRSPAVSFGF